MDANVTGTLIYRRMELDDTDAVVELGKHALSYVDLAAADPEAHDYVSLSIISSLTYGDLAATDPGDPMSMSFVAEIDGQVVGFLLAYTHFVGIPLAKICMVHAIVVDPEYHGQGIGTQLFQELQDKCQDENIQRMRILIPDHNKNLVNYLTTMGFHQSNVLNFDRPTGGRI
jgi:ribosomal protein S18 acetylase RimI-like enzyme